MGTPTREIAFNGTIKWVIFHNSAYSNFIMVRMNNGGADAIYSMSKTWKDTAVWNAAIATPAGYGRQIFADNNDSGREYACAIYTTADNAISSTLDYDNQTAVELLIFELTNAFRGIHNVSPLTWSATAAVVSRAHSTDMATQNYFDHYSLANGQTPGQRLTAAGVSWSACSENIMAGGANAMMAVNGWINSSDHRTNMLSTAYTHIGVGYAMRVGSSYTRYYTQNYYKPW